MGITGFALSRYKASSAYHQATGLIVQIIVAITLAMRTYALYTCSRKVLAAIIVITIITLAAGGYSFSPHGRTSNSGPNVGISKELGIRYAVAWETLLFFEFTMFAFLMYRTVLEVRRRKREPMQETVPILRLLIRDGALYFATMFFVSLANILTFYVGGPHLKGFLSPMVSSLSATMISRLSLNLRAHDAKDILGETDPYLSKMAHSAIQFAQSQTGSQTDEEMIGDVQSEVEIPT
ncbi:hypothetical protein DL96DRAFT_1705132 [Flagelloscypha sp. PMI_526]|nr:hypothetical protein DL96DRAFT_1705132 [Flagelloscypha sp. PMI_526]